MEHQSESCPNPNSNETEKLVDYVSYNPNVPPQQPLSPASSILRRVPAFISVMGILVFLVILGVGKNQRSLDFTSLQTGGAWAEEEKGLLYFNADKSTRGTAVLSHLPHKFYPKDGPCISVLVTNRTKDVEELQVALTSLAFLTGDTNPNYKSPVLVFNEGNLTPLQIVKATDRPVAFPLVDFSIFPTGFDPSKEQPDFLVKGRENKWGYYQMIRFWVTGIWEHPALAHFETIMRIDSDSCFKEVNDYLPNFHHPGLVYHSQYVGVEDGAKYLDGLFDFAVNYMETSRAPPEPRNFLLWDFAKRVWDHDKTLPVFRTNFEVSSKMFMQSKIVRDWHFAITEKDPYGVLTKRWGDAVTRFLTAALFENMDKIFTIRPTGYFHKIGCSKAEVDEALLSLNKA